MADPVKKVGLASFVEDVYKAHQELNGQPTTVEIGQNKVTIPPYSLALKPFQDDLNSLGNSFMDAHPELEKDAKTYKVGQYDITIPAYAELFKPLQNAMESAAHSFVAAHPELEKEATTYKAGQYNVTVPPVSEGLGVLEAIATSASVGAAIKNLFSGEPTHVTDHPTSSQHVCAKPPSGPEVAHK